MQSLALPGRMTSVQTPIIPVVAQLIRDNPGTISLGQGVVGYPPPPEAVSNLRAFYASAENHKYKPVQGIPELVSALQEKLASENRIWAAVENIFVTAGGNMAFMNAIMAITDPGDEIILQSPYYFNHEMAVTMLSCRPVLAATDQDYQLNLENIRACITAKTKAIVTISPNNPTGAVYSEDSLRAVNELCREHGIFHINDEAYEYFTWEDAKHFSPGSLPGAASYTISLFSLSKAYGFASWRIGYMTVPSHLTEAVRKIQDTNLICAPVISQYAAVGALSAGRHYCEMQLDLLRQNRETVLSELLSLNDLLEVPRAKGAFYFLPRLKRSLNTMEFTKQLITDFKVAIIPGVAFGLTNVPCLRVAYGALTPENAYDGITRLTRGLRELVPNIS